MGVFLRVPTLAGVHREKVRTRASFTVDFNSLWPRGCGNILGTWELRYRIRGFIVIVGNQIANFETKTASLISKLDSKFANFASKLEKQL